MSEYSDDWTPCGYEHRALYTCLPHKVAEREGEIDQYCPLNPQLLPFLHRWMDEYLKLFGNIKYFHIGGDEPGREPNIFYTADYLADAGFEVILAPAASSFGDTVFAPRDHFHLTNTFDMAHKELEKPMPGSILTSWTVQLHPYELQRSCIDVPPYVHANPSASLSSYRQFHVQNRFGTDDPRFAKACGLLSKSCLFSNRMTLGYCKTAFPVPLDHVENTISQVLREGRLLRELDNCLARLVEYGQGLDLLQQFTAIAPEGHDCLNLWDLGRVI